MDRLRRKNRREKATIQPAEQWATDDADLAIYLSNLDDAFTLPMDQLMYYYSAHEMSPRNERIFNEATWAAVERTAKRPT